MIIGNFTYNEARNTYTGELATLSVAARKVVFQPNEAKSDKGVARAVLYGFPLDIRRHPPDKPE